MSSVRSGRVGMIVIGAVIALAVAAAVLIAMRSAPVASPAPSEPEDVVPGPRVVTLSPALAAIAADLGFERFIVGRHGWDIVLDPSLPVCGDQSGVDYEALLAVSPTHIYIQWGARELPDRLATLADRRGWTVRALDPLALADITGAARAITDDLGPLDPENTTASARVEQFERFASGEGPKTGYQGRVLLLASADPPAALGPRSFHHEMLEAVGGVPALDRGSPWIELDREDLIAIDADAIVLFRATSPGSPAEEFTDAASAFAGLRAHEQGRVAVLSGPEVLLPGTRLLDRSRELRETLDSWASAIDPG
ncbi:MAG: hypothetical protein AAGG07_08420 [Planctomycetota bacterium]